MRLSYKRTGCLRGVCVFTYGITAAVKVVRYMKQNICSLLCLGGFKRQRWSTTLSKKKYIDNPEFSFKIMKAYYSIRVKKIDTKKKFHVYDENDGVKVVNNFINMNLRG